jgi:hypothetical protein
MSQRRKESNISLILYSTDENTKYTGVAQIYSSLRGMTDDRGKVLYQQYQEVRKFSFIPHHTQQHSLLLVKHTLTLLVLVFPQSLSQKRP